MRSNSPLQALGRKVSRYTKRIALVAVCCCASFLHGFSQERISLDLTGSIKTVLKKIEKKTSYSFVYADNSVDVQKNVSVRVSNESLDNVLKKVFEGTNIQYAFKDKQIALYPKGSKPEDAMAAAAQTKEVGVNGTAQSDASGGQAATNGATLLRSASGRVLDQTGEPLPGASIMVKGSVAGQVATSDIDGKFKLNKLKPEDKVIVISFIGMQSKELAIPANGNVGDVMLMDEETELTGAVVTGYQTISKERVTGSFAKIESEDLNKQLSYNIASGLEGKVAGVVKNGNDLTIRGRSTFNAIASPLYVIDGFPVEGDSPSFYNSAGGSVLEYGPPGINPEEIENITVLKDAAAASIYGSRAANGVIVITTKKAKKGAAQVNFSTDISVKPAVSFDGMDYMSASGYIDMQYDYLSKYTRLQNPDTRLAEAASIRDNTMVDPTMDLLLQVYEGKLSQEQADAMINAYRSSGTPITKDFEDYILRPTVTQRYYLSVGKATEGNNVFGSITYNKKGGETKKIEDNSLEINLRNSFDIAKWLNVELNANIRTSENQAPQIGGSAASYVSRVGSSPYTRIVDDNGNPIAFPFGLTKGQKDILDVYANDLQNLDFVLQDELNRDIQTTKGFRTRASVKLNFKIVDWLTFSTSLQYEAGRDKTETLWNKESYTMRLQYDDYSYLNATTKKVEHRLPYGDSYSVRDFTTSNFTQRNQLNVNYTTNNKLHSFAALLGTETRQIEGVVTGSRVWGYDDELQTYVPVDNKALGTTSSSILGRGSQAMSASTFFTKGESLNRFVSFYGNAMYTFNNRFDLTGSIRWDLSNLFGTDPKNQYRPLWSVGAGWNMGNEEFLKNIRWIDRLKLRATYGINGNIAKTVSPYLIAGYWLSSKTQQTYGMVTTPPNAGLRWEKTAVFNVGVDFDLFRNRLSGSLEYYRRNSSDLLSPASIDPTFGFSKLTLNAGAMVNQGVEADIKGILLERGGFRWMAGLTFAYNHNEVTKLYYFPKEASNLYANRQLQEGYPYGSMYSYRFVRIDDKGEAVLYDGKGNEATLKSLAGLDDVTFSGSTTPLYSGSIYTSLAYKGFELSANFIYNAGHVMRKRIAIPHIGSPQSLLYDGYDNAWKKPGDELKPGVTPRITYYNSIDANTINRNTHWKYNSAQVVSAGYIKLRSLSLSYSLPQSLLKKTGFLKAVSFRVQADNLFFLAANKDGIDPERFSYNTETVGYSITPTYSFGANISF